MPPTLTEADFQDRSDMHAGYVAELAERFRRELTPMVLLLLKGKIS